MGKEVSLKQNISLHKATNKKKRKNTLDYNYFSYTNTHIIKQRIFMKKIIFLALLFSVFTCTYSEATLQITRPDKDKGPTKVFTQMAIIDMDDVDTAKQTFESNVFYSLTWHDSRLANLSDEKIRKSVDEVWTPGIQFINQQRLWKTFPEIVDIYPSGKVVYKQRVWGSFSQPLELRDFPFDTQSFNVYLTSTGYDDNEVLLIPSVENPSFVMPHFSVADWKTLNWDIKNEVSPVNPNKTFLVLSIKAIRNFGYFIIQMIIPLIIIVMMSWTVFWIDPDEGGVQIGVSTTAILTLIAYKFMVGAELPKFSYLTRLDSFILAATVLVFLSLVEVVITSRLAKHGKLAKAQKIDKLSRVIFPTFFLISVFVTLIWGIKIH